MTGHATAAARRDHYSRTHASISNSRAQVEGRQTMKKHHESHNDYIAIILVGAGSSWARGPDRADCIERVKRMVVDDWSSLFEVAGKPATINVAKVYMGEEYVWWDSRGVYAGKGTDRPLDVEQVEVVLPTLQEARA